MILDANVIEYGNYLNSDISIARMERGWIDKFVVFLSCIWYNDRKAKNTVVYFILSIWNHVSFQVLLFVFEIEKHVAQKHKYQLMIGRDKTFGWLKHRQTIQYRTLKIKFVYSRLFIIFWQHECAIKLSFLNSKNDNMDCNMTQRELKYTNLWITINLSQWHHLFQN